nr:hypothetical protein CPGR_05317 [Mycolicibacterium malmesburyense]
MSIREPRLVWFEAHASKFGGAALANGSGERFLS